MQRSATAYVFGRVLVYQQERYRENVAHQGSGEYELELDKDKNQEYVNGKGRQIIHLT